LSDCLSVKLLYAPEKLSVSYSDIIYNIITLNVYPESFLRLSRLKNNKQKEKNNKTIK